MYSTSISHFKIQPQPEVYLPIRRELISNFREGFPFIMPAKVDITGQKFNRLTVLCEWGRSSHNKVNWLCVCDCGKEVITTSNCLKKGNTGSCGCLRIEAIKNTMTTHGDTVGRKNSSELVSWYAMRGRCLNPENKDYKRYGGRGITICERWNEFKNFLSDMGRKPDKRRWTIERIDNNGNYEPTNCKWVTQRDQNRNRGNVHVWLEYEGKQMILSDVAREIGITPEHLRALLRSNDLNTVAERFLK